MSWSLIDVTAEFGSEEACLAYLEKMRWPDGVRCLKCGGDKVGKFTAKGRERFSKTKQKVVRSPDRHLYQCLNKECLHQFTATVGTIFNDTHLPLSKWFMAVALMTNAKKGLSALQLQRDLGVKSYRTAWYLAHRIRKAMEDGAPGMLEGVVEADETFIGGKYNRRLKREPHNKPAVFGALQRGTEAQHSKVRAFPISGANKAVVTGAVLGNVSVKADLLITDESPNYRKMGTIFKHETVNHIRLEYVRQGDPRSIHTNSIENFWSLFKRGVIGSYHKVSVKHLRRYLDEFTFRFNNRTAEDLFAMVVLNLVIVAGVRYAELTSNASSETELGERPF